VLALACVLALGATPLGPRAALAAIHGYQGTVGPLLARAGFRCRFTPSCSHYAEAVIARDGLLAGGWKTARRLAHCGPWTAMGTRDDP